MKFTFEDYLDEWDRPRRTHEAWQALKYTIVYEFESLLLKLHFIKVRRTEKPNLDLVELSALQRKIIQGKIFINECTNPEIKEKMKMELDKLQKRYNEIR